MDASREQGCLLFVGCLCVLTLFDGYKHPKLVGMHEKKAEKRYGKSSAPKVEEVKGQLH